MSTVPAIVQHLMRQTGLKEKPATILIHEISTYLVERTSDPSLERQIVSIVNEPEDPSLVEQLLAAVLPPSTPSDGQVLVQVLEQGVDVNHRMVKGVTPLHIAARLNRLEMVRLLLLHGAEPNVIDDWQNTPLQLMADATYPNPDIATLLLEADAEPSFFAACALGDMQQVRSMLQMDPGLVNMPFGADRETGLHLTVARDFVELAQFLLESGADLQIGNSLGLTPLHVAASCNCVRMAELLIEYGAAPNAQTDIGATPLDLAVKCGRLHSPMVALLLSHGGQRRLEDRLIKPEIFMARLQHYYEQHNDAQAELKLAEDGTCIATFNIWPKDSSYCIPKVHPDRGKAFQDEALEALKEVFFPGEAVTVRSIQQWEADGDVVLEVELPVSLGFSPEVERT